MRVELLADYSMLRRRDGLPGHVYLAAVASLGENAVNRLGTGRDTI